MNVLPILKSDPFLQEYALSTFCLCLRILPMLMLTVYALTRSSNISEHTQNILMMTSPKFSQIFWSNGKKRRERRHLCRYNY